MAPSQDGAENGRALGATEENWTKATAGGTGVQVLGFAFKRIVEMKQIILAAKSVMECHALLRSRIVENSKGKLVYQVSEGSSTPSMEVFPWPLLIDSTTAILILPGDNSDNNLSLALNHIVKKELNTPFPNASQKVTGPMNLFQIHVYTEPSQPKTIIVLRFVSGGLDRPSAVTIGQSFLTALNCIVDGQELQLPEVPGKNELLPAFEDMIPKGKSKGFFQKGLDTVGYAVQAGKYTLFPFHSGFSDAKPSKFQSDILSYSLGKNVTSSFLAACEREKTTPAAALTAAFLKAAAGVKELKEKKSHFSFTSIVDCRPYFEPPVADLALGNYSGGVSQDEIVKPDADLWELARSVSSATEKELAKSRQFSEIPVMNMLFSQVLKRPNLTPKSSLRTALCSAFTKTLDSRWKNVEKLNLAGTFGPFASMHGVGPCFSIGEALVEGPQGLELTISLVFPTPVFSRDQMAALASSGLQILSDGAR